MVYLKEDGSLDVERINNLPIEEFMEVVGEMTSEQFAFESKTPINEGKGEGTKAVDFLPMDEVIERGIGVDADVLLNKLREKLKRGNKN